MVLFNHNALYLFWGESSVKEWETPYFLIFLPPKKWKKSVSGIQANSACQSTDVFFLIIY